MKNIVIANSSVLIILDKVGLRNLLRDLYGQILIPEEVAIECERKSYILPEWVKVVGAKIYSNPLKTPGRLGLGETGAIKLALAFENSCLIIDDRAGRSFAEKLGLDCTGSVGILLEGKKGLILSSIKPHLLQMVENEFYLSDSIIAQVLKTAGEE